MSVPLGWAPHVLALPFDAAAFGGVTYVQFVLGVSNEWWFFAPRLAGKPLLATALVLTSPVTGAIAAWGVHKLILSLFVV